MLRLKTDFRWIHSIFALVLLLPATGVLASTDIIKSEGARVKINFLPGGYVEINGDSTMRKYSAKATEIELKGNAINQPLADGFLSWTPINIEMRIETKNLKSDSGTLDEHMHEAMKMKQYSSLIIKVDDFVFGGKDKSGAEMVSAHGSLTLAGVTKPILLKALLVLEGDVVRIKGHQAVLMSDFGIDPPTMMLGAIKTKDAIDINFELTGKLYE